MASTTKVTTQASPLANQIAELSIDDALACENVFGAGGSLLHVEVDNSATAHVSYVKLYNAATAVVGTTNPDMILPIPAGETKAISIPGGISFANGVSIGVVQEAGTPGTTPPTAAVIVRALLG